ncbi:conjugal transfer protein, partial [Bacillus cereus]|nr:conjugal transfer protein [Bacillus cereus]
VTWRALGYFAAVEAGLVAFRFLPPFKWIFGDMIDQVWLMYYGVIPLFLVWGADKYKTDGKSLFSFVRSWVTFRLRKHQSSRLVTLPKLKKHVIRGHVCVQYDVKDISIVHSSSEEEEKDIHAYNLTFLPQKEEVEYVENDEQITIKAH